MRHLWHCDSVARPSEYLWHEQSTHRHQPPVHTAPPPGHSPNRQALASHVTPGWAHTNNHVSPAPLRRQKSVLVRCWQRQRQEQCWCWATRRARPCVHTSTCQRSQMPRPCSNPRSAQVPKWHVRAHQHATERLRCPPSPPPSTHTATAWAAWASRRAAAALFCCIFLRLQVSGTCLAHARRPETAPGTGMRFKNGLVGRP
jgi:hypothetical protein